jgi:hypothetical protein
MHVTRAFDICMTKEGAESASLDYQARLAASPGSIQRGDVRVLSDPVELESVTGIKGGLWGASYPAGHLWPYKLATAREFSIFSCAGGSQGMKIQPQILTCNSYSHRYR